MKEIFEKIQQIILQIEDEHKKTDHQSGNIKKVFVIATINSFLTPEQRVIFDPILADLIDVFVKLMNSDRMLGLTSNYCCF